jgi:hypothetical protein
MIMGYLNGALALLKASGLLTRLILGAGAGVALLAAYGVWHHRVYESGVEAAIAGIAREDSRWIDRAVKARGIWRDCRDQGGNWDQTTGRCR